MKFNLYIQKFYPDLENLPIIMDDVYLLYNRDGLPKKKIATQLTIDARLVDRILKENSSNSYKLNRIDRMNQYETDLFKNTIAEDVNLNAGAASTYDKDHPWRKHFTKKNFLNYHGQKSSAKKRNIPWHFDFESWLLWWLQTGKFNQRGVHNHKYHMCRKGDVGPYSWDNVYCATGKENRAAYQKNKHTRMTVKKLTKILQK